MTIQLFHWTGQSIPHNGLSERLSKEFGSTLSVTTIGKGSWSSRKLWFENAYLLKLYWYGHTFTLQNFQMLNCTDIRMGNRWLEMIPSEAECWRIYLKRVQSHMTASVEVHVHTWIYAVNQFKQLRNLFISEALPFQPILYTSCVL